MGFYLDHLYYNLMMLMGDPLGLIPDEQHAQLQPYAVTFHGSGYNWVLATDPSTFVASGVLTNTADPLTGYSAKAYIAGHNLWVVPLTEEMYNQSLAEGKLLGLLPWSTKVLQGTGESVGHYYGRADYHWRNETTTLEHLEPFNEWSGPLLMMKLQTLGILSALGVGTFLGVRYAMKRR